MDYKNYFLLQKFSLKYKYCCFFDTKDYLADGLFIKNKVKVCFQQEYQKQGMDFRVIFCKVRKKDVDEFVDALEELKVKMLLLGYTNYPKFCEQMVENLQANAS